MEPNKKIKIKKTAPHSKTSINNNKQQKQDALEILENTVKKLQNRFNQYGFNDSKEEAFLEENKGKEIVIELTSKTIEGVLESIDKYRVCLSIDGTNHYFYKHAIIGYHPK